VAPVQEMAVDELVASRSEGNSKILSRLREDCHAQDLYDACMEDARLGRMTVPAPVGMDGVGELTISPRFGVEQGAAPVWLSLPSPSALLCVARGRPQSRWYLED